MFQLSSTMGYSREYPHTPMDGITNPVKNSLSPDWNSLNFPNILWILTGIPGKPFKILQNSGIPQEPESQGFGILHKLLLSFLEIPKFLGTQFIGGLWIFSGIAQYQIKTW